MFNPVFRLTMIIHSAYKWQTHTPPFLYTKLPHPLVHSLNYLKINNLHAFFCPFATAQYNLTMLHCKLPIPLYSLYTIHFFLRPIRAIRDSDKPQDSFLQKLHPRSAKTLPSDSYCLKICQSSFFIIHLSASNDKADYIINISTSPSS